ncbi:MAG: TonB-dependent receptor, partial [Caulobacteraceae bacterium]
NLQYKPNEDTLLYLKYSRGYKAGGIVLSAMTGSPILDSEHLNAYEVGYKFSPNRKLTVNTAAFYYDYANYQDFVSVRNLQAPSGFSTIGFNIPKSRNYGFELTSSWHPTSHFTLTATGNYLSAEVTDGGSVTIVDTLDAGATGSVKLRDRSGAVQTLTYKPQPCGAPTSAGQQPQCIDGDSLKGASPWKVWLSADYRFDFAKGSLDTVVAYSWRAGNVSTYSKNPVYESDSYNQTDLRLVWRSEGSKYSLIGFVNNVFDQIGTEYVTASADLSGALFVNQQLTIPRTWGIELQTRF